MNHAHSSSSESLSHLFKSSEPPVKDDLTVLPESIRSSSFALVPSALTPSRAPCNTAIASSRIPFFNGPVHLDFSSGWEKGPVTDWYNKHRTKGSTAIDKIQLRKSHQHPYYHEYIIVSTRGGHTYRVDRRPDADAPFDTIMKAGCTAYDTIEEVHSTPLKELHRTSGCVVELHWRGQTIDLLYILSICFAIHSDKRGKRYTLQCYNCYFLSWAIIVITMRKSAVCGNGLNIAVQDGIRQGDSDLVWNVAKEVGRWVWRWKQSERAQQGWDVQKRELALELVQERVQKLELELESAREQMRAMERERGRERERGVWVWVRELEQKFVIMREQVRVLEQKLASMRVRVLELERELMRERQLLLVLALYGELSLSLEQALVMELERELVPRPQQELEVERDLVWRLPQQPEKRMQVRELAKLLVLEPEAERQKREQGLNRERERRLEQKRERSRERRRKLEWVRAQERERATKLLQERVLDGLGQIPLVLGWAVAQDWNLGAEGKNDPVTLPDRLVTTISYRQVDCVGHIPIWSDIF